MTPSDYPRPDAAKPKPAPASPLQIIYLVGVAVLAVMIVYDYVRSAPPLSLQSNCLAKVKLMTSACLEYAIDNDDNLPTASRWMDLTQGYGHGRTLTFHDPKVPTSKGYGYAFRAVASRRKITSLTHPAKYVLVFDSAILSRNAAGEPASAPEPGRHGGTNNFGFLDGHAESIKASSQ